MDLITMYRTMKLTDEEIVIKFFKNINARMYNKDNYIRDFEDFYFKIRPKFGPKLIKLLLEVRNTPRFLNSKIGRFYYEHLRTLGINE